MKLKYGILNWLAAIVLTLIPLSLATIYFFPLFPDEIAIRTWLSRLPYDFPYRTNGLGRCWSEFYQTIPISQYIPAGLNWLTHGLIESPTSLRKIGILIFLIWIIILISFFIKNNAEKKVNKNYIQPIAFIFSLFFIGIMPIFLGVNRSEQFFYPSIIILLILSFDTFPKKYKITSVFLYLLGIMLILYGHPKGLFLTPFFIVVGWQISKKFTSQVRVFLILFSLIILISYEAFKAWGLSYQCREIPEFENFLKGFSFDPFSVFYDPIMFFDNCKKSFFRFNEYLDHAIFKSEYIWDFLPKNNNNTIFISIVNVLVKSNIILIYFSVFFILLYSCIKDILKNKALSFNLILIILYICIFLSGIFNLTKNIYDTVYIYYITLIIFIFWISFNKIWDKKQFELVFIFSCFISIISQVIFISNNLNPFLNGFTGPGISIGFYEKNLIHNAIAKTSQLCGLDRNHGKFIVIDDLTYGYFRRSHGPISASYNKVGVTKTPLQDLFRTLNSDGMILECNAYPGKFRHEAIKVDNICCMSKSEIKRLFIDNTNSELE